jgi:predicted RNA-binding Zn-ribbon protein involved in translation (DUF1610 family)
MTAHLWSRPGLIADSWRAMASRRKVSLRVLTAPPVGAAVIAAPPLLTASDQTIDFTCGNCGTALLQADENQVHNLVIHCSKCGAYNSTDL